MDPANLPSNPQENASATILGSTVSIVTLATIVVLARLYVRVFIIRGTGWDVSLILTLHSTCFLSSLDSTPIICLTITFSTDQR
jgi:hypothetical protein